MNVEGKKIFVGLSGGVDSAVTAALLQAAGAHVVGLFIKGWYPPDMPCTWADDRRDAMRVAAHLGIPFHTLEAGEAYKKGVIDYLLAEYAAGRTPNPDIMCNREVKFGAFYQFAKAQGADLIATGHYAQSIREGNRTELHRGIDADKDQSYFLWAIPQEALDHTIFPLGGLEKREVRARAKRFGLPVADKKDSQGICFLGSISVEEFLEKELGSKPGKAIDAAGAEVGMHNGAVLHTLGERIALQEAQPGPWYVVSKDMRANTLTVAHALQNELRTKDVTLREANWFAAPSGIVEAQYRYHGPRITGTVQGDIFRPEVPFTEPVAAGQSLVLYRGEQCLGGGIIA